MTKDNQEAPLFCENPACELHVRAGDPGVDGAGNWATLRNGRIVGRGRYDEHTLCDPCGQVVLDRRGLSAEVELLPVAQEPGRARRRGR